MTLSFKYKTVKRPDGSEIKTPSIPITLFGSEVIDTLGLIDSGADISAISKDMAETLCLDMNAKITSAFGIGGKVDSIETTMTIEIRKGHEQYRFVIPVKVILDHFEFPLLLGRSGFFDQFKITFSQKEGKVTLKKQ